MPLLLNIVVEENEFGLEGFFFSLIEHCEKRVTLASEH